MNANLLSTLAVIGALAVVVVVVLAAFLPKILPALEALPR